MRGMVAGYAVLGVALVSETPDTVTLLTVPQHDGLRSSLSLPSAGVSAGGRYVAFASRARLALHDTDDLSDVYVLDRENGNVTLESLETDGRPFEGECTAPRLSGDGRYLVFEVTSFAESGGPPHADVVVRDRLSGTSRRLRPPSTDGWAGSPDISADGRVVVFTSSDTTLIPETDATATGPTIYAFRQDRQAITRIGVDTRGLQARIGASYSPRVSADGRYVAFVSTSDLDGWPRSRSATTPEPRPHVYVHDAALGVTRLVSIASNRAAANGPSRTPAISGDGRYVAFVSDATNLVRQDNNRSADVFLYDMRSQSVSLVSRSVNGGSANGRSTLPAISSDGRFVVFQSDASDLICSRRCAPQIEDFNLLPDVFLFDRITGTITIVSRDVEGGWAEESGGPSVDASGDIIAFTSRHPIDARDVTNDFDLFVRLRRP